jgi:WD40 repeat protein
LAFRPRGTQEQRKRSDQLAAAADQNGRLIVWNLDTFDRAFEPRQGPPQSTMTGDLAYSPDGSRLVQVGIGDDVAVWNADNGQRLQSLQEHVPTGVGRGVALTQIEGVDFSPDGSLMATCGNDGVVSLWNVRDNNLYIPIGTRSTIRLDSYRAGHPSLLPGQSKLSEGEELLSWTLGLEGLLCVRFTHDGKQILTSGWGGSRGSPLQMLDIDVLRAAIDPIRHTTAQILTETERLTGLHHQPLGLEPIDRNHLVPAQGSP